MDSDLDIVFKGFSPHFTESEPGTLGIRLGIEIVQKSAEKSLPRKMEKAAVPAKSVTPCTVSTIRISLEPYWDRYSFGRLTVWPCNRRNSQQQKRTHFD